MKKSLSLILALGLLAPSLSLTTAQGEQTATQPATAPAAPADSAGSYIIDPTHSSVLFSVSHLGYSQTTGRFNKLSGNIEWNPAEPEKTSLNLTIKTASVDSNLPDRDAHLRNPDYFNADVFPEITYKTTSVKKIDDDTYEFTGDVTLLGVTKPLTTQVDFIGAGTDPWGGYRVGGTTRFTIKRSDFGMSYGAPAVGDEVSLVVDIEGIRQ